MRNTLLAELALLIRVMRLGSSLDRRGTLWSIAMAVGVALVVPSMVVVLVNEGRELLIKQTVDLIGPQQENRPMLVEWHQQWVLVLGTTLAVPSLLLAGTAVGATVFRHLRRDRRILAACATPAAVAPFFGGLWFYLYRLWTIRYPGFAGANASDRAPILAAALAAAKRALDTGTAVSGAAVGVLFLGVAARALRNRTFSETSPVRRWRCALTCLAMLALASLCWWSSRSMATENRTPFPGHDHRFRRRAYPPIPPGLSQDALHALAGKVWMGYYNEPLSFPLVAQEEDALVAWSPLVKVSVDHIVMNGYTVDGADQDELRQLVVHERSNDRELRGDDAGRGLLLLASPDLPVVRLASFLAVVCDVAPPEVRLVTGLPETIYRPAFGALTRVIYQTTTVRLARASDLGLEGRQRALRLSDGLRDYGEVLDRALKLGRAPLPPVLMLD